VRIELSVVIPTFNEKENIEEIIQLFGKALYGINWEVIFVDDDSPDGTADFIRNIAMENQYVRLIQRIGLRGLSSSCIEGMLASAAPYIAVMDADMQHDETLLPVMLRKLKQTDIDIVIGSRYIKGGSIGELDKIRTRYSRLATILSRFLIRKRPLTDPMSGFFMLKRTFFEKVMRKMSGKGFKILLDIFAASDLNFKYTELPYKMRCRKKGVSKLDNKIVLDFLYLIIERSIGRYIPVKFLLFVLVGGLGLIFHLLILYIMHSLLSVKFYIAQLMAIVIAMTSNFILNNAFTYKDTRLSGLKFIYGIISFYIACSIGALVNMEVAYKLYTLSMPWYLAGLIGAGFGGVWNFAVTSTITWHKYD